MQSKSDLDQTIARLERSLLSDTADDQARKIDLVILGLTKRRDALYDRAFPTVGGTGVCKDGAALDAVGAIDKEIHALKITRTKVLSGVLQDSAPRPKLVDYVSKGLLNPFDTIARLPEEEAERKK